MKILKKATQNLSKKSLLKILTFLFLSFSVFPDNSFAFDRNSYSPSEIDETVLSSGKSILAHISTPLKAKIRQPASYKYKFSVFYGGKIRPISKNNLEGLQFFEKTYPSLNPKLTEISKQEILIKSAKGKEYWLPIQDVLIDPLKSEIKSGEIFNIYVLNPYNAVNQDGTAFSVFLIGEFDKFIK